MTRVDNRLLETLRELGNLSPIALSNEGMVSRVDTTAKYAGERCKVLARYGLVEYVDSALYRITDEGRAYLDEELDASTLDELDEPRVADG